MNGSIQFENKLGGAQGAIIALVCLGTRKNDAYCSKITTGTAMTIQLNPQQSLGDKPMRHAATGPFLAAKAVKAYVGRGLSNIKTVPTVINESAVATMRRAIKAVTT